MGELGGGTETTVWRLANRMGELDRLHLLFGEAADRHGWSVRLRDQLALACDELLTNTISYGYPDGGDDEILLELTVGEGFVEIALEDGGVPFDPIGRADPDITLGVDEREIGGLGVFFVKQIMDDIAYERTASGNRIAMRKTY